MKIADIKEDDIFICIKSVYNILGSPLFNKGDEYVVLNIDDDEVTLDHILYANEYMTHDIQFINKYFTKKA